MVTLLLAAIVVTIYEGVTEFVKIARKEGVLKALRVAAVEVPKFLVDAIVPVAQAIWKKTVVAAARGIKKKMMVLLSSDQAAVSGSARRYGGLKGLYAWIWR